MQGYGRWVHGMQDDGMNKFCPLFMQMSYSQVSLINIKFSSYWNWTPNFPNTVFIWTFFRCLVNFQSLPQGHSYAYYQQLFNRFINSSYIIELPYRYRSVRAPVIMKPLFTCSQHFVFITWVILVGACSGGSLWHFHFHLPKCLILTCIPMGV